jgi:hypothetical protein
MEKGSSAGKVTRLLVPRLEHHHFHGGSCSSTRTFQLEIVSLLPPSACGGVEKTLPCQISVFGKGAIKGFI